nr:hypothetical protein [candidate division Zixibacteria bacterium]
MSKKKRSRPEKDDPESTGASCPISPGKNTVVYISEGQLCPNCGFASLQREPGNIIRCPICGYGNGAGCT